MRMLAECFYPVLLSMAMSFLAEAAGGRYLDVTERTCLAGLLTCLAGGWCFYRENARNSLTEKRYKTPSKFSYLTPVLLGIGGNLLFSWILARAQKYLGLSNTVQEELLAGGNLAVRLAGFGILVPIGEELIFRGLVYRNMRRYLTLWKAAVLAGMLFALSHGNALQFLYAFPMGILLNLVYERQGSLKAPAALHIAANLTTILLSLFQKNV